MARCGCSDACSCTLISSATVTVQGSGTSDNPYVMTANESASTSFQPPDGTPDNDIPIVLGSGFQWVTPAQLSALMGSSSTDSIPYASGQHADGTTDNSSFFNSVSTSTGAGTRYLKSGVLLCKHPIVIPKGCEYWGNGLRGSGLSGTTIRFDKTTIMAGGNSATVAADGTHWTFTIPSGHGLAVGNWIGTYGFATNGFNGGDVVGTTVTAFGFQITAVTPTTIQIANTSVPAASGTGSVAPYLITYGDGINNTPDAMIKYCQLDANDIPGAGLVYAWNIQENAGLDTCDLVGYRYRGVMVDGTGINKGAGVLSPTNYFIDNIRGVSSALISTNDANCIGYDEFGGSVANRGGMRMSFSNASGINSLKQIRFNRSNGIRETLHVENATDGITVGDIWPCVALELHNATGQTGVVNVIRLRTNARGPNQQIAITGSFRNSATRTLQDDLNSYNTTIDGLGAYITDLNGTKAFNSAEVGGGISGGGGGGGTDPNAVHYTLDSPSDAAITQALNNIKAMRTLRPEQFGAKGDAITDDSVAFHLCKLAGLAQSPAYPSTFYAGMYIQLEQGTSYYLGTAAHIAYGTVGLFDFTTGVYMGCPGGSGRATSGSTQIIGDHTFTGFILDTPAAAVRGCGLDGIHVLSDMSSAGANPIGGIRFQAVTWGHIMHCGFDNVTDVGMEIIGVDCHLENIASSHKITGRTLTAVTPSTFIGGTDHYCVNIEGNGGNDPAATNAGTITVAYPYDGTHLNTCYYHAAIQVQASEAKFIGVNGEFADVGWYLGGPAFCTLNQFIDTRGDYNAAHGYYATDASWNLFQTLSVYNNSCAGNGTYNGFHMVSGTTNCVGNRFGSIVGGSPAGASHIMGYYYVDLTTGTTQMDANMVTTIGGMHLGMTYDYAQTGGSSRYAFVKGGAASYVYRPQARMAAGCTWYDNLLLERTMSDGNNWRDISTGALNGNMLLPQISEHLGGAATGWFGGSTPTAVYSEVAFNTVSTALQKLNTNQIGVATANAAGVTAGAATIYSAAAGLIPCVPGQQIKLTVASMCAPGTPANVAFVVDYYTSANVLISGQSDFTDTGTNNAASGAPVIHAHLSTAAPATTAKVGIRIVFTRSGMALNEKNYFGLVSADSHTTATFPVYS